MRLLTSYYKPKQGGFCKRYFRSINALLTRGHQVHYLALQEFPIQHPNCVFHKFYWPFSSDTLIFWAVWHLCAPIWLGYLALKLKIDRCFAFSPSYGFLMQPAKHFSIHKHLTVFCRGDSIAEHRINNKSRLIIMLDTLIEGLGLYRNNLYCVSNAIQQQIMSRHSKLVPSSVGLLRNSVESRVIGVKKTSTGKALQVACVGNLEPLKNHEFLIDLWQQVDSKLILNIYGSGSLAKSLRLKTRDYGLDKKVIFHGWRDETEIWSEVDLLVCPSLLEGAPNVVLEAYATDTEVLASDILAHKEILPERCICQLDAQLWVEHLSEFAQATPAMRVASLGRCAPYIEELTFDWDERISEIVTG